MKKLFALTAFAVLLGIAGIARADIPPPPNMNNQKLNTGAPLGTTQGSTPFAIEQRSDIDAARLQIPRSVLANMQAAGGTTNPTGGMSGEAMRTLFAGVFLSCALAFGGVWVLRSRKDPAARVAAMMMIAFAVAGTATTIAWANAAPPRPVLYPVGSLPKALKNDPRLYGTVLYEVVEGGSEIRLLIPSKDVKRVR
ncbi:MAG: hypothetical protein ABIP75_10865 [Pyrinomonadaceae bacterium]